MAKKGRSVKGRKIPKEQTVKGESHSKAKLTDHQVLKARERYRSGQFTQKQLADELGVSSAHMCGIIKGKFWSHLPV